MTTAAPAVRRWLRRGFLLWAAVSTAWLADSMRTRDVPDRMLRSSASVTVVDNAATMEFVPTASARKTGLIFFCGSGVSASAYAPLLRPLADAGFTVSIVRLPYRFAPFEANKLAAIQRAEDVIAAHPGILRWVVSGHSLGGALSCRLIETDPRRVAGLVLIGTTHPKDRDLSSLAIPVTKVYATNDGVAPAARVLANRHLLPAHTTWVQIRGGNHSQFGNYGRQLLDGKASISREAQQALTRAALLDVLTGVERGARSSESTSSRRSYFDHGGTTPLVRAYAMDCPRCSCWSPRMSISALCFVMSLPNSFTGDCRSLSESAAIVFCRLR